MKRKGDFLRTKSKKIFSVVLTLALLIGVLSTMFVAFAAAKDANVTEVETLITAFSADHKVDTEKDMKAEAETAFNEMLKAYNALTEGQKDSMDLVSTGAIASAAYDYYASGRTTLVPPTGTMPPLDKTLTYAMGIIEEVYKILNLSKNAKALVSVVQELHLKTTTWNARASTPSKAQVLKLFTDGGAALLSSEYNEYVTILNKYKALPSVAKKYIEIYNNTKCFTAFSTINYNVSTEISTVLVRFNEVKFDKAIDEMDTKDPYKEAFKTLASMNLDSYFTQSTLDFMLKGFDLSAEFGTTGSFSNLEAAAAWSSDYEKLSADEKGYVTANGNAFGRYTAADSKVKTVALNVILQTVAGNYALDTVGVELIALLAEMDLEKATYEDFKAANALYTKVPIIGSKNFRAQLPTETKDAYQKLFETFAPSTVDPEVPAFDVFEPPYPVNACKDRVEMLLVALDDLLGGLIPADLSIGSILPTTNAELGGLVNTIYGAIDSILASLDEGTKALLPMVGLRFTPADIGSVISSNDNMEGAKTKLITPETTWANIPAYVDGDWGFADADATPETTRKVLVVGLRKLMKTIENGLGISFTPDYALVQRVPNSVLKLGLYETLVLPLVELLGYTPLMTTAELTTELDALTTVTEKYDYMSGVLLDTIVMVADDILSDPLSGILQLLPKLAGALEDNAITPLIQNLLAQTKAIVSGAVGGLLGDLKIDGAMVNGILTGLDLAGLKLPAIPFDELARLRSESELVPSKGMLYENRLLYSADKADSFMVTYRYIYQVLKDNIDALPALLASLGIEGLDDILGLAVVLIAESDADTFLVVIMDLLGIPNPCPQPEPLPVPPIIDDVTKKTAELPATSDTGIALALAGVALAGAVFVTSRKKKEEN